MYDYPDDAPILAAVLSPANENTRTGRATVRSMFGRAAGVEGNPALACDAITTEMANGLAAMLDPEVEKVVSQAEPFDYADRDGVIRSHTPDLKVIYRSGWTEFWICKDFYRASKICLVAWRDMVAKQIIPELADDILIKTQFSIDKAQVRLNDLLHQALHRPRSPNLDKILTFVGAAANDVTVADIAAHIGDETDAYSATLRAVATHQLVIDRTQAFSMTSIVSSVHKDAA